MAYDRFTIAALVGEFAAVLEGRAVRRVAYSDEGLYLAGDQGAGVWVGLAPPGCLMVTAPPSLQGGSGHDLERFLNGARVLAVTADPVERILRLRLERPDRQGEATYGVLILELIPSRWLAALVSVRSGRVLARLDGGGRTRCRMQVGDQYEPPQGRPRLLPGQHSLADFADRVSGEDGPVRRVLARSLAGADDHVAGELLHRTGLAPCAVAPVGDRVLARLWTAAEELYGSHLSGEGYVWSDDRGPAFSALRPQRPVRDLVSCPTVSQAVAQCHELALVQRGHQERQQRQEEVLFRRRRLLERRARALACDLVEATRAEELERLGTVLLSHLAAVRPGARQVRLPDAFDTSGEAEVVVDLEPGVAPAEQAARMLKTARRLHRRQSQVPPRQRRVAEELARLAEALDRLHHGGGLSPDEEREWMDREGERRGPGRRAGGHGAGHPEEAHPRRYRTSSGWLVLAGRSNTENDILTHRMASQEDIWFHASGYSGSHVILKREGRREEPGSRTLEEAAAVAAYWSKGRTARKVPVIYTRAKHVSKPRGGAPGLAVVRREKTLMVAPALLPQEDKPATEGTAP